MKKKPILSVICMLFFANPIFGQIENDTIRVLAKQVSQLGGSKIQFSEYKVLKNLDGRTPHDVIQVQYYFYNELQASSDTALLTLIKDKRSENSYSFPEYNPKKGIEEIQVLSLEHHQLERVGKGMQHNKELNIVRDSNKKCFLLMPRGGTETSISLSKSDIFFYIKEPVFQESFSSSNNPPIVDFATVKDGLYYLTMLSCSFGKQIKVNLRTK